MRWHWLLYGHTQEVNVNNNSLERIKKDNVLRFVRFGDKKSHSIYFFFLNIYQI